MRVAGHTHLSGIHLKDVTDAAVLLEGSTWIGVRTLNLPCSAAQFTRASGSRGQDTSISWEDTKVLLSLKADSCLKRAATTSPFSYLSRDGLDGEDHITGDFAHIADLEAGCGPVPNQNIGEDELVLICDEHTFVLHGLQDLAEVGIAADTMLLKDGTYVINHKRCEKKRGLRNLPAEVTWTQKPVRLSLGAQAPSVLKDITFYLSFHVFPPAFFLLLDLAIATCR